MVAEVAGSGEIGRAPVFVAGVSRDRVELRLGLGQFFPRPGVEREGAEPQVVFEVAGRSGAGAHDHSGDARLFQHLAAGDIREGNAEPVRHPADRTEQALEAVPAPRLFDEAQIL